LPSALTSRFWLTRLLLLPDTDGPGAITAAEKLRAAVESMQLAMPEGVSASFGVAILPTHALDADSLLRAADRALYAAKNAGRNRVEVVEAA
jgi:diguanylate cyclase (GGDEF)-like protein